MNLSESLADAYDAFKDPNSHLLLAKNKKGKYQLVADAASAKELKLKVASAAKTLKLLADDSTNLEKLTPRQKENLKRGAEHLALRAQKEISLDRFKNKILQFFRTAKSKAEDTDYQKVMKALEAEAQSSIQANAIYKNAEKLPISSLKNKILHFLRREGQPSVQTKGIDRTQENQFSVSSNKGAEKLPISSLKSGNAMYYERFSSAAEQNEAVASNESYASVLEDQDSLTLQSNSSEKEGTGKQGVSSAKPTSKGGMTGGVIEDDFSDLFIPSALEGVADFKKDFDEMFSRSRNPPFTFDETKLKKHGITLEDLQLIHYFRKDAGVPPRAILKYQKGYSITTCDQVSRILSVATSSSEVLEGSLSVLQRELQKEGKPSFSVLQIGDDSADTTLVDPSGRSITLDEYIDNPQKAVYINFNNGHFTLIKLDPNKKEVQFYDSLGKPGVASDPSNMQTLKALADKLKWKIVIEGGPRQYNGTDCGLFCYEKARRFCKGVPEDDFTAEDIPYVRLEAVASYLKSSRILSREQSDWFVARLKIPTSVYYFNSRILPSKVDYLKDCLERKKEPQGLTRAELESLVDKKKIPQSCIPKILDHIDDLVGELTSESEKEWVLRNVPSREKIDSIVDERDKEKLLIEALKKIYNNMFRGRYEDVSNNNWCVTIALLLLK